MAKIKLLTVVCFVCMFMSCGNDSADQGEMLSGLQLNFQLNGASSNEAIEQIDAFLYNDGILKQKYLNMPQSGEKDHYQLMIDKVAKGRLVFFANTQHLGLDALKVDETGSADLARAITPVADFQSTFPIIYYTSELTLEGQAESNLKVSLQRSLARLDLHVDSKADVVIDSCRLSDVVDRSFILPGNPNSLPGVKKGSMKIDGNKLTEKDIEGFAYLYESSDIAPTITFYTRSQGVKNKQVVQFAGPIERNKKYRIDISNSEVALDIKIVVLPWEEGSNSATKPEPHQ